MDYQECDSAVFSVITVGQPVDRRTGRMGRTGIALTLVADRDLRNLQRLLRVNRIEPMWQGEEPDLSRAKSRSGSSGGGRRGGRSRRGSRRRGGRPRRPVASG